MTAFTGEIDTDIMWGGKDKAYVKLDVEEIEYLLVQFDEEYLINRPLQKKLEKALMFFKEQKKK